jgi:hypothetical protein
MLVAVVALGMVVVLKGILSNHAEAPKDAATAIDSTQPEVVKKSDSQPRPPVTNVVATTPVEDHQAGIDSDVNQIKTALLEGSSNSNSLAAVRERLLSPEASVRKAAVEAAMHLNDREAIPKLKEALGRVEDTREKVAILDAIEYLQIPEPNEQMNAAPDSDTPTAPPVTNRPANPKR